MWKVVPPSAGSSPLMHSSKKKKNTFATTTKVQPGTTSSRTNIRDDIIFITRIFLLTKLVQYSLIFFTPETPFDTSTDLLLDAFRVSLDDKLKFWNRHVWNKLLSWDAVFFIKGMVRETVPCSDNESPSCCTTAAVYLPEFEHEFAFSSLWISTVRWMAQGVFHFVNSPSLSQRFYITLKIAVLTTNVLHYLSSVILYFLTLSSSSMTPLFDNNRVSTSRIARKTAVLFIFSSAAGFLSTIYSEPLSFFTTFIGLLSRSKLIRARFTPGGTQTQTRKKWVLYLMGTTLPFILATINRSNCILLGLVYLYDFLHSRSSSPVSLVVMLPLTAGLLTLASFIIQQYYIPYNIFCYNNNRPAWCDTSINVHFKFLTKQSLYKYIQAKYWNVGFLKYWTVSNIPNFVFALPNLVTMGYASWYYYFNRFNRFTARPLAILTAVFLTVILMFAHVQIINRVSSFIPLHLWFVAERLSLQVGSNRRQSSTFGDKLAKCYVWWLVLWVPLQTVLFASFLPPA